MHDSLHIRLLQAHDIPQLVSAFAELGWNKPATQYECYLAQQAAGQRTVFVAFLHSAFAGYVTVNWQSDYQPFQRNNIPEIQDFNVLPQLRRQGIGTQLLDIAEACVAQRSALVGIGVGMTADYGAAHCLYVQRGYIPDGRGLMVDDQPIVYGQHVLVDDNLVLYFTKTLRTEHAGPNSMR